MKPLRCVVCDPVRDKAPDKLGYVARSEDAQERLKRGEKQKRCPQCKLYYWPKKEEA